MISLTPDPEPELHREIRGKKSFVGWDGQARVKCILPSCPPYVQAFPWFLVDRMLFLQGTAPSFIPPEVQRIDLVRKDPFPGANSLEGVGMAP